MGFIIHFSVEFLTSEAYLLNLVSSLPWCSKGGLNYFTNTFHTQLNKNENLLLHEEADSRISSLEPILQTRIHFPKILKGPSKNMKAIGSRAEEEGKD